MSGVWSTASLIIFFVIGGVAASCLAGIVIGKLIRIGQGPRDDDER